MAIRVFISHASRDKELAAALVQLLRSALKELADETIRCSSVDGFRLPAGTVITSQLMTDIRESEVAIVLLTPKSDGRDYVQLEVGALLATGKRLLALMAGNVDLTSSPLASFHVLRADNSGEVQQLVREAATGLGCSTAPPEVYQARLDDVVRHARAAARVDGRSARPVRIAIAASGVIIVGAAGIHLLTPSSGRGTVAVGSPLPATSPDVMPTPSAAGKPDVEATSSPGTREVATTPPTNQPAIEDRELPPPLPAASVRIVRCYYQSEHRPEDIRRALVSNGALSAGWALQVEDKALPGDWGEVARSALLAPMRDGSRPDILVIHFSCFQDLPEWDRNHTAERLADFRSMLNALANDATRFVVYSRAFTHPQSIDDLLDVKGYPGEPGRRIFPMYLDAARSFGDPGGEADRRAFCTVLWATGRQHCPDALSPTVWTRVKEWRGRAAKNGAGR